MRAKSKNNTHIVVLQRGEEVISTLTKYLVENRITAGIIQGIGALEDSVIGYFDVETKDYLKKTVPESCELLNFLGNISFVENKTFIHAHILLGNKDFNVQGGHCFSAKISVTGEFYIYPLDCEVHRAYDEDIKLNLISL